MIFTKLIWTIFVLHYFVLDCETRITWTVPKGLQAQWTQVKYKNRRRTSYKEEIEPELELMNDKEPCPAECLTAIQFRTRCSYKGNREHKCIAKGCCWDKNATDYSQRCFKKDEKLCDSKYLCSSVLPMDRTSCTALKEQAKRLKFESFCVKAGCCWDESVNGYPRCFDKQTHKTSNNQCDNILPNTRIHCGYPGIKRNSCFRKGCCFFENKTTTLCFYRNKTNLIENTNEIIRNPPPTTKPTRVINVIVRKPNVVHNKETTQQSTTMYDAKQNLTTPEMVGSGDEMVTHDIVEITTFKPTKNTYTEFNTSDITTLSDNFETIQINQEITHPNMNGTNTTTQSSLFATRPTPQMDEEYYPRETSTIATTNANSIPSPTPPFTLPSNTNSEKTSSNEIETINGEILYFPTKLQHTDPVNFKTTTGSLSKLNSQQTTIIISPTSANTISTDSVHPTPDKMFVPQPINMPDLPTLLCYLYKGKFCSLSLINQGLSSTRSTVPLSEPKNVDSFDQNLNALKLLNQVQSLLKLREAINSGNDS